MLSPHQSQALGARARRFNSTRRDWRNAVYVRCDSSSERNVTARAFPSLLKLPRLVTIHVWPLRVILSPTTKIRSVSQNCVSPFGNNRESVRGIDRPTFPLRLARWHRLLSLREEELLLSIVARFTQRAAWPALVQAPARGSFRS